MEYGLVVLWWLLFAAIAIAGLPIAATVMGNLPDRGAGVALPVGVLVLVVPVYWLGQLTYGPITLGVGTAVLVVGGGLAAARRPAVHPGRFAEAVAVFTAAYLLLVGLRAYDPAVIPVGGEKFLDYGLLNAVLRADHLPPEDMWFAGDPVRYYYGGHLIAASLAGLTGTAARYAYNLALAGFFGMLVAAAYGIAGSMAAARGGSYRFAGLVGAVFVGLASNLVTAVSVLAWVLPPRPAGWLVGAVADRTALELAAIASREGFFYWSASRVIPGTINEFPFFAWLNGDLHAHMVSTPFTLVVVALGLTYFLTPADRVTRRRLVAVVVVPPVVGFVAVVNTWSFPTVVGITGLAIAFAPGSPTDLLPSRLAAPIGRLEGWRAETARYAVAAAAAGVVGVLGLVWSLPFFVGPASTRPIGLLPDRSGLLAFLLVHGAFLLVFGVYLGARAWSLVADRRAVLGLLGLAVVAIGAAVDAAAAALTLVLLGAAWWLLRRSDRVGYEAVLLVAGAGLALLVEFVFIEDRAGPGRFNTVFKTYAQVWLLWAVAAAVAFEAVVSRRGPGWPTHRWLDRALPVLGVVLLVAMTLYAGFAIADHGTGQGAATLDATTAVRTDQPETWATIEFLADRHPQGRPVVVSAPGCACLGDPRAAPYSWANAIASFTGLPTVAGWEHEIGYRSRRAYLDRVDDVRVIYTGTWPERIDRLVAYDVRYVYVGPTERALYDEPSFEDRPGVDVAYRTDGAVLYEVQPDELRRTRDGTPQPS